MELHLKVFSLKPSLKIEPSVHISQKSSDIYLPSCPHVLIFPHQIIPYPSENMDIRRAQNGNKVLFSLLLAAAFSVGQQQVAKVEAAAASAGFQLRDCRSGRPPPSHRPPGDEPHPPRLLHLQHQRPRQQLPGSLQSPFGPNSRQMTSPRFLFSSFLFSVQSACCDAEESYTSVDIGNCLVG